MAFSLPLIVLLGLSCGLWVDVNAWHRGCNLKDCCKVCPEGWTEIKGRCYLFHYKAMDWCDAEMQCIQKGGNLASPRNPDEVTLIRDYVFQSAGRKKFEVITNGVWFGGYDAVKESYWKWSDGGYFEGNIWSKDEPNNLRDEEHCLALTGINIARVNDISCGRMFTSVCTRDLVIKE